MVDRARAAGIARLVTISTRVARHAQVLAIAERFPDVFCSVGTHPHYAHEELHVTAGDLVARTRHPKIVAIGEAGLDYHYDNSPREAQERGFRSHIAAARETGLPLVIHSRDADDDMARILEEETGKGAFPAVLHCFTGGRELAQRAVALGHFISFTGILTFKNSTALREIAAALAGRPHPGRDRCALSGAGKTSRQTQRAGFCDRHRQCAGRDPRRRVRRHRAADDGQFLPPVRQSAAAGASGGMTLKFTILGCGSSGGVPRPALGWGACDPTNPRNRRRRTSLLVERRDNGGVTRILVDTSPDLREQLLDAEVDGLDAVLYTHEHADHTHGVDDLRALYIKQRRPIDVYLDDYTSKSMHTRFGYCFHAPPGSEYPPIVREHRLTAGAPVTVAGKGGPLTALPILQQHGDIASFGFRFGNLAYSCDLSGMPPESAAALTGLDVWIVDALRYRPHPSHFSLDDALEWIGRLKPRRAILTNLHADLDYEELYAKLPANVEPAYDGMTIAVPESP